MPESGALRQDYVQGGQAKVGFIPYPDAQAQIDSLSSQLTNELKQYRAEINRLVKPWSDRWAAAQGYGAKIALLQEARNRGMERGAHAWVQDNVSFMQQVGGYMSSIGHYVVEQGEELADWYSDLPLLEKMFPTYAAANTVSHKAAEAIAEASEEIQKLWAQRQALLDFFKAIHDQSINAVQIAIETLSKMGGELGQLMKMLWDHGAAWMQGLIEVCRQTDALQKVFASVGALFTAIPMNLWAEGIGMAGGYIIPELLVSALLAILAALTEGGAAPILAARLIAYGDKIKNIFTKLGELGPILTRLYNGIKEIRGTIVELTRAAWRNIEEKSRSSVDKLKLILRSSKKRKPPLSSKKTKEIVETRKGQRPEPSTYLPSWYQKQHLDLFNSGAVRVVDKEKVAKYGTLGPPGSGIFCFPKSYVDEVINSSEGDMRFIEEKLGLDDGYLNSGNIGFAEIPSPKGVKIPSGNEPGANPQWMPGGYTSGGIPEAIVDHPASIDDFILKDF